MAHWATRLRVVLGPLCVRVASLSFLVRVILPLAVATLEELDKLQGLNARGVILERQYEVIKKHIMEGNSLTTENWKAFDLAWKLKMNGGFLEEEWTTQIGGDISVIVNSARPSLSSQHASTPTATQATKTTTVSCVSSTSNQFQFLVLLVAMSMTLLVC